MSKLPVGIQLYSVRDDMSKDMAGTIKAIGAMGYAHVEFAGVFGPPADEVKKMCEALSRYRLQIFYNSVDRQELPSGRRKLPEVP